MTHKLTPDEPKALDIKEAEKRVRKEVKEAKERLREKVRENRLRRMLTRRGYTLMKSRRRDPQAVDYGTYIILDTSSNCLVAGTIPNSGISIFDLDDVEEWLKEDAEDNQKKRKRGKV